MFARPFHRPESCSTSGAAPFQPSRLRTPEVYAPVYVQPVTLLLDRARRPRNRSLIDSFNPGVDIYQDEDVLVSKKGLDTVEEDVVIGTDAAQRDLLGSKPLRKISRRSDFGLSAQRESTHHGDQSFERPGKMRRASVLRQDDTTVLDIDNTCKAPNIDMPLSSMTNLIKKPPRRQSTIILGAKTAQAKQGSAISLHAPRPVQVYQPGYEVFHERSPQSGYLVPQATVSKLVKGTLTRKAQSSELALSSIYETGTNTEEMKISRRRQSLPIAPCRVPLGSTNSQRQLTALTSDVRGSGPGKENIPPGERLLHAGKSTMCKDENSCSQGYDASHRKQAIAARRISFSVMGNDLPSGSTVPRPIAPSSRVRKSMIKSFDYVPVKQATKVGDINENNGFRCRKIVPPKNGNVSKMRPPLAEHEHADSIEYIRSVAHKIHQSSELSLLHRRLEASLRFGGLSGAKDAVVKAQWINYGAAQRRRFLDLWVKIYDHTCLQGVLAAVIGPQVLMNAFQNQVPRRRSMAHARPGSGQKLLEDSLLTFLISQEDSDETGRGYTHARFHSPQSIARDWRRMAVRSLILILMLDRLKTYAGVKKCIFQATSPFKSSVDVLHTLALIILPAIGDVRSVLSLLEYRVSYVRDADLVAEVPAINRAIDLQSERVSTPRKGALLRVSPPDLAEHSEGTEAIGQIGMLDRTYEDHSLRVRSQSPTDSVPNIRRVNVVLTRLQNLWRSMETWDIINAADITEKHRKSCIATLRALLNKHNFETLPVKLLSSTGQAMCTAGKINC